MFTYKETIQKRREKIEYFLNKNQSAVAVIMAAANFEWTLRRAILALGKSSTKELRSKVIGTSGLDNYKKIWGKSVISRVHKNLQDVIPNWSELKDAYKLRHQLVHGEKGTTGLGYAKKRVETFLTASETLNAYVISVGAAIYGVRIRRVKYRQ